MKTTVAVIDFGTSKIVTAIAENGSFSRFDIRGTGTVPYAGYQDGEWIEPIELKERIKDSVTAAEYEAKTGIREIFVSVPADRLRVVLEDSEVEISSPDGKVSEADMDAVHDAAAAHLGKLNGCVIHRSPAWFSVDGGRKSMTPMQGIRRGHSLRALTSFLVADEAFVKEIREIFSAMNIKVLGFVSSALCSALMYIPSDERDRTAAIADVGYLNTEFTVVEGDAIVYHKVLPVGGGLLTADIAENFGLSMDSAEKIKREFSFDYDELAQDMPKYSAYEDGLKYSFEYLDVANAIGKTCEELIVGLQDAVEEAGTALGGKSRIYLTGGGLAPLKGAGAWLAEQLDYDVKPVQGQSTKLSGYTFTGVLSELDQIFDAVEPRTAQEDSLPGRLVSGVKNLLKRDQDNDAGEPADESEAKN